MAFIRKQTATRPVPTTGSGAGGTLGAGAAQTGTGAGSAAPQDAGVGGTGFVNLQRYLAENQPAIGRLAEATEQNIEQETQQLQTPTKRAMSEFQSQQFAPDRQDVTRMPSFGEAAEQAVDVRRIIGSQSSRLLDRLGPFTQSAAPDAALLHIR